MVPNALLPDGLAVMKAWGFTYKANIVWHKVRKDGGSDGRGVGFYFRNVTELLLFGVKDPTPARSTPGRTQVNFIESRKREHSRKPDEQYALIEACSPGPFIELFARAREQGELFPCRQQQWYDLATRRRARWRCSRGQHLLWKSRHDPHASSRQTFG